MKNKTYSTAEVAKHIRVTRQTLYNWIEAGLIDAPEPITAGNNSIRIWTREQLAAAKKFKGTLRPGRPKEKREKKQKDGAQ